MFIEENKDVVKGIKMSVTPFLLVTDQDVCRDGWKNESGKTVVSEILLKENIHPDQMTKVLLSDGRKAMN